MRNFIKKTITFLTAAILIVTLCNILMPITAFVYRPWEALVFSKIPADSPFYPNATLDMNSQGDLCHHSKNSILKKENWKIDEYGFRNDKYMKDIDVLIIGDSYITGSGLTQECILTNQLIKIDTNLKVYNMAPSSISQFDKLLKTGKINKPKRLIFSISERNVPPEIQYYSPISIQKTIIEILSFKDVNTYIDYFVKALPLKWIKARIRKSTGLGIQGVNNSKMFFFQGVTQKHEKSDLKNTVSALIGYKKYCDSLGIKFIFMPMPDKETVYYEFVPFKAQPKYLFELDSLLKMEDIPVINTLKIYNDYKKENRTLLYHLDDTHWNSNAVKLIAGEIFQVIKQN